MYPSVDDISSFFLFFFFLFQFQYVLMDLIKKELKSWSDTLRIDNVPKAPTGIIFFSFAIVRFLLHVKHGFNNFTETFALVGCFSYFEA